jgi:hypothetical protein
VARTSKSARLNVKSLLATLGFNTNNRPAFTSWREWLEHYMERPLARPTLRAPATHGWHQKRNWPRCPNYAKLLRRQARAAA